MWVISVYLTCQSFGYCMSDPNFPINGIGRYIKNLYRSCSPTPKKNSNAQCSVPLDGCGRGRLPFSFLLPEQGALETLTANRIEFASYPNGISARPRGPRPPVVNRRRHCTTYARSTGAFQRGREGARARRAHVGDSSRFRKRKLQDHPFISRRMLQTLVSSDEAICPFHILHDSGENSTIRRKSCAILYTPASVRGDRMGEQTCSRGTESRPF